MAEEYEADMAKNLGRQGTKKKSKKEVSKAIVPLQFDETLMELIGDTE